MRSAPHGSSAFVPIEVPCRYAVSVQVHGIDSRNTDRSLRPGRAIWNLALAYGPRKRKSRLLLVYILPFVLVLAGMVYGVSREKRKADLVFDALESRLRAFSSVSQLQERSAEVIRTIVGPGDRIQLEIFDAGTSALFASNARKGPRANGLVELRFQRRISAIGRSWIVSQLRRTPLREMLLAPQTLIWATLIVLPVILLSRGSRRRRSFELGPNMLDALGDVIVVVDLQGRVGYVSPSIGKNFGYVAEEVLDRNFTDLIHGDDLTTVSAAFENIRSSEEGETIRGIRVRDKRETWHHIEGTGRRIMLHGRVIAILITMHDVTPVISAQDALWVSEERFRRLFDSIQDYAIVIVDLAGRIVSWNRAAQQLTGYAPEEIIGQPLVMLHPEDMREPGALEREVASAIEEQSAENEEWRVRKDGTRFLAQIIRSPLPDRFGRVSGFSLIMRDVTERRVIEAQLFQAQRLDSLGKLAGGIAHDFNNMLMVIFSRTELLLRADFPPARQRRFIEDIKAAACKSRDLTQQLLAAARRQVLQPEIVQLIRLCQIQTGADDLE